MTTTLRLPSRTPGRAPAAWTLARAIAVDVGRPLSWVTDRTRRQMVVDLGSTDPETVAASCRLHIPNGITYEIHPAPPTEGA